MTGETNNGKKEGAAEAIENNIRRKVVEKVNVNPKYYEKMSIILAELIAQRKRGVEDYAALLETYIELASNVEKLEENEDYPESIRKSHALQALYDNSGCDEQLAIKLHQAVIRVKQAAFRGNPIKENCIKRELFKILNDKAEVERIYIIIEKQEEY